MKMVLTMLVMFFAAGRLSTRVNSWTLAILLTGILCVLFLTRITF